MSRLALEILACLLASGFFAGLETGLLAANRALLEEKRRRGVLYARTAEYLLGRPSRMLGVTLVGTNVANVTAAVLLTDYFASAGLARYAWAGVLGLTLVFVVFADLIPKSLCRRYADTLVVRLTPLLAVFYVLLLPVHAAANAVVAVLMVLTGQSGTVREEVRSRRDLRFLVHLTSQEVGLAREDRRIIDDILDFREQSARDVMIPFHQVPVLAYGRSLQDAAAMAVETGWRFLPVARARADDLLGYIDTTELLWRPDSSLDALMREAVFFPETSSLAGLLLEMDRRGLEVAFLVDEHGGMAGVITPEQIIGDIVHYVPERGLVAPAIERLAPGRYRVSGQLGLEDLGRELGVSLRRGYNRTVGGWLCERLGVIPPLDATYREAGYTFRVIDRDARHVKGIEITKEG